LASLVRCNDLKRPRDELPRVPLGLYLKIAYELHKVNFSLRRPCQGLEEVFTMLVPDRKLSLHTNTH